MVHPDNRIFFSAKKKKSQQAMKSHRGNWNAYYKVNETDLKAIYFMSPAKWRSRKDKVINKKTTGYKALEQGRDKKINTKDF